MWPTERWLADVEGGGVEQVVVVVGDGEQVGASTRGDFIPLCVANDSARLTVLDFRSLDP